MKRAWLVGWLAFGVSLAAEVVSFQYHDPAAQQVSLAGEYSEWRQLPMRRDDQGVWRLSVDLAPGFYGYKFVVNGSQSVLDPVTTLRKEVGGIENSAVRVGESPPVTPVPVGPNETPVTFVYTNTTARQVAVAGGFNSWSQTAHPLARDSTGVWRATVPLKAGRYFAYKFVVDGEWIADPGNAEVADDGNRNWNSVALAPRGAESDPVFLPNVAYHDRAQRTFVAEVARVLAWRHNQSAKQLIAAVKWEAATSAAGVTEWQIAWVDEAGGVLRQRRVSYPEAALRSGPKFYRDVFQSVAADWLGTRVPVTNDLAAAFWRGADSAGRTRVGGLRAAQRHLARAAELLQAAQAAPVWRFKQPDQSADRLSVAVPLLRRGETAGWGAKRPVAVATAEELLQYGWEMTGVQMGERHPGARSDSRVVRGANGRRRALAADDGGARARDEVGVGVRAGVGARVLAQARPTGVCGCFWGVSRRACVPSRETVLRAGARSRQ